MVVCLTRPQPLLVLPIGLVIASMRVQLTIVDASSAQLELHSLERRVRTADHYLLLHSVFFSRSRTKGQAFPEAAAGRRQQKATGCRIKGATRGFSIAQ